MDYKFKGAFDSTVVYELGDVVNYGGNTWYLAKPTGAAGVIPGEYWNHWLPVDQDAGDVFRAIEEYGFMPAVSNPQDGDVLVYDGTAGKWKNGAAGGGGMTVDYEIDSGEGATTYTFKAKAGDIYNALDSGSSVIIRMAMDTVPEGSTGYMTGNFVSYAHITSDEDAGYYFNAQIDGATIENAFAATANDFPVAQSSGASQS